MESAFERQLSHRWTALIVAGTVLAWTGTRGAEDEGRVKAGLHDGKTSGCPACRGAFADGDKEQDEAPTGANLRITRLDNAALTELIRCGRPDTGMPRFDEGAYTQRGCNGQGPGPVPSGLYPTPRMMSADEIEAVVAYLRTRVIGRREITPEDCAYYYEDLASTWCDPDQEK